jgi:RHS repeat-associated protein
MKHIFLFIAVLGGACALTHAQTPTATHNYTMETVVKVAGKKTTSAVSALSSVDSANRSIQYLDGLGRPMQSVAWQGSPTKKDVVSFSVYDSIGRETRKYLPYAEQTSSNGSFKTAAGTNQANFYSTGSGWDANIPKTAYPYSTTVLEPSPLNRPLEQGAPGAVWQPYKAGISGSGHTVKMATGFNASGEVQLWTLTSTGASTSSSHGAKRLFKTIVKDENWTSGKAGTTAEFKDPEGRVLLKRQWLTSSDSLSTYYVYDVYGSLRYVIPPAVTASFVESDAAFKNFVYAYRYDGRRRLIEKKIPGKGWEQMVYNKLDQLVLTQDSVQRAASQWLFTKYDALGRTIITGLFSSSSSRATWQASIDAQTYLWEGRDDANANSTATGYTNVSLPTTGIVFYHTIAYFDNYSFYSNEYGSPTGAQVPAERTRGLLTGEQVSIAGSTYMLPSTYFYDSDGRMVQKKSRTNLTHDTMNSTYNFAGELTASMRISRVGATSVTTVIENSYSYDHMGRKISTKENINSQGEVVLNKLEYNEIGQLKQKHLHSTNGGSSFYQDTKFSYNERGWLKGSNSNEFRMKLGYDTLANPQYNGNISTQLWGGSYGNQFNYTYDGLNRLNNGTSSGVAMGEILTYDVMGNIATMNRDGGGTATYSYTGNQLTGISGGGLTTAASYAYNGNGNATTDGRLGTTISYNHLNLPSNIAKTGLTIDYGYLATGQKLYKVSTTGLGTVMTHYIEGIQYNDYAVDFIQTEEGRAVNNSGTYTYQYNLTDHLGNVRYSFDIYSGAVRELQRDDYYAFGLRKAATAGTNNYLYNGKELQDELGQYDYGARFYDPIIGRWNVVDPLADHSFDMTPYHYCSNNPMNRLDPDGMCDKPNCPHRYTRALIPVQDPNGDQQGFLRNATVDYKESHPVKAFIVDLTQDLLDVLGVNAVDNLFFSGEKITAGKVGLAALAVIQGMETVEGGSSGKPRTSKIKIDPEMKIDRSLLDPPTTPGNAPTFKEDGKSVEIHHVDQKAEGPYQEMHPNDHRMGENYKKNHPSGQQPLTKQERKDYNRDRRTYWQNEYKFKPEK